MKKETILGIVVALIVGLLGGYLIFSISGNKSASVPAASGVTAGGGSPTDYKQRIEEAQKIVAKDPKNIDAWIQLGNDYFDTDQAQKAIEAYGKALELNPNNPNVLTDQGIMFRRVGWFDKAIANFEKAQKIDPKHLQSLYNLGVIYAEDLKQPDKALKPWSLYVQLDSTSPTGQQVKMLVDRLKSSTPQK